jgi:Zn-dependent metalloprotease/PKD repeat protein
MKKIITIISASLLVFQMYALEFTGAEADRQVKGADRVIISETRNSISYVHLQTPKQIGDHNVWLREVLKAGTETSFELYNTQTDQLGWTNFRYRQLHNNVPLEGAVFYVHVKDGNVISANGEFYTIPNGSASASVSEAKATNTGRAKLVTKYPAAESDMDESKLVFYRNDKNEFTLCWKVDAFSLAPMLRYSYYVNAQTGAVIGEMKRSCEIDVPGTAQNFFNGPQNITCNNVSSGVYHLNETVRNINTHNPLAVPVVSTSANWTTEPYATDAHWAAENMYDFLSINYGWIGQNGTGQLLDLQVHDGQYVNAYWNGSFSAYGDGDGTQYYPLTSMEIVGHEIAHGVTEFSAALVYAGESGALNESFSDIFGNALRFIYNPSIGSWMIGDQIVIPNGGGTPFRNMANPNQFQCADTYGGLWFNNGDIVHYDSGIQNHWFYLLCTGGSGTNDLNNNFAVTSIGINDAMDITFRNLTTYLTPNATFLDARTYAEQSAVDLFGSCSNQLIQTANAWYAVGVGTPSTYAVTAAMGISPSMACSVPATVNFTNYSFNSTSWYWDFGDGNTSTLQNPSNIYLNAGTYNVTLIATGTGNCSGVDTLVVTSAVTVNNVPGPVANSCYPQTTGYCCGYGIQQVQFHTINWSSNGAVDGYSNFTCADSTLMVAGNFYPITITTSGSTTLGQDEAVSVWIDYNSDGIFNNTNEYVYFDNGTGTGIHNATINTPVTATLNTRLRMRVISDKNANSISNACYAPQFGQVEDYMVYFVANSLPPIANFTANVTTIPVGSTVAFTDLSVNVPTSWNWTFTGGSPGTSTLQVPPAITYNTVGIYPVTLSVTNGFGSDVMTQTTYINVVNSSNICQNFSSSTFSGTLYDSGGPNGNYLDNQNCTFLISPSCASNLSINFTTINIESNYDYLTVYDGTNNLAPILGSYSGLFNNVTLNSTSGSLFITFTTDVSVVLSGFAANWTSTPTGNAPVSNFSFNPSLPMNLSPVQFTDLSTNSPTAWAWNFGDAGTSAVQNPVHTYALPGSYTVTLIATNCISADTIYQDVLVNPNGVVEYSQAGFSLSPNPMADAATIQLSAGIKPADAIIEITDVSGRVVRTIRPASGTITIYREDLSNGIYFVNLYLNNGLASSQKMIVTK